MDRRQHERYDLQAPLTFSWNGPGGARHRRQGLVRNMSGGGLFVSTGHSPPEGARIQFNMSLSSLLASSQLILRAYAQVVRVELAAPVQARAGFAAAIKTFTLRNDKKKLIERGIVGEGLKGDKFARKKTLIKSGMSTLRWA
jgi:PilZ domain